MSKYLVVAIVAVLNGILSYFCNLKARKNPQYKTQYMGIMVAGLSAALITVLII